MCGEFVDDAGVGRSPAAVLTLVGRGREGFVDDTGLRISEGERGDLVEGECGELADETGLQRSGGADLRITGGVYESYVVTIWLEMSGKTTLGGSSCVCGDLLNAKDLDTCSGSIFGKMAVSFICSSITP